VTLLNKTETSIPPNETKQVLALPAKHKYVGRIVPAYHAKDLRLNIEELNRRSMVDKEFYQERLAHFDFRIPENAKSLIIVAAPRPQSQAIFKLNGETIGLIIPPTYVAYERTRKRIEDILSDHLKMSAYSIMQASVPLKLLAAQSGLCGYGKNNICYISGMGSFFELAAFYSDMPVEADWWQEPQMMPHCENCSACRLNCPTGAISDDRFLLYAERCLVFHNEKKGNIQFAKWIDPSWHNCLVGCMLCQKVCPQNKEFIDWIVEKEEFSEEETNLFLKRTPRDQLFPATLQKLENLDLLEEASILPRNLSVHFAKKR
jgi:epoxyqueuosine reductase